MFPYCNFIWDIIFLRQAIHPLNPLGDKDRIFLYNINTISSRPMMRIRRNMCLNEVEDERFAYQSFSVLA